MAKKVRLGDCPPGLFVYKGTLGFKSEYGAMKAVNPNERNGSDILWVVDNYPDVYCADSGERFWGGVSYVELPDLMVKPIRSKNIG